MEEVIQGRATMHSDDSDELDESDSKTYRPTEFFRDVSNSAFSLTWMIAHMNYCSWGVIFERAGCRICSTRSRRCSRVSASGFGVWCQCNACGSVARFKQRLELFCPPVRQLCLRFERDCCVLTFCGLRLNYWGNSGFLETYWVIREKLHMVVRKELIARPAHLYVTGHSLGGALATFAAFDLSVHSIPRINAGLRKRAESVGPVKSFNTDLDLDMSSSTIPRRVQVTMYNFGSPRVGNRQVCAADKIFRRYTCFIDCCYAFQPQFAVQYNRVVPDSFRVVVDGDVVTAVPGAWYKHVGTEVVIDSESNTGTIIIDPR